MRKFFLLALCALTMSACADDKKVITFDMLPDAAQALLKQYVNEQDVLVVAKAGKNIWADYEVLLPDCSEWDFDADGKLESVEMSTGVPDALIPEVIRTTVAKMYPNAIIVEYSIDHRDQEVKLNNRIELTFDLKGKLIETDID